MKMFLCSYTIGEFDNAQGEHVQFARVGLTDMESTAEYSVERPLAQEASVMLENASKPVPVDVDITIQRGGRARVVGIHPLK